MRDRIEALCAIAGISGREDAVRDAIRSMIDGYCSWHIDPLGNLIAEKKGAKAPRKKLLLSAHMDEVGFIVTRVEENGLLRFAAVGGIDPRTAVGKPLLVGEGQTPGVIGTKAVHLQESEEKNKAPKLESLYIDIGADSAEQALALVRPGDMATYDVPFTALGDRRWMGRAIDDRAGCALLVELIRSELAYDCTFAFTVQEEIGCVGGGTAAYGIQPDFAIAVETTTAADIGGVTPEKRVCALGKGPVISYMDRGAIYDRAFYRFAGGLAEELHLPWQTKEGIYGGNEARSVQVAGAGCRVLAISLPCRYLHSPSCVMDSADATHTLALLRGILNHQNRLEELAR